MTGRGSFFASPRLLAALLIGAVLLSYAGGLRAPFLFDDEGAVVQNATIRDLWSPAVFQPPADGSTATARPLVNFSFALNYALSGEHVGSYHLFNVALHAAAALALFSLVRRTPSAGRSLLAGDSARGQLARAPSLASSVTPAEERTHFAFFVALLWALHPLQTETVQCIAQRTELLCGALYLLTLAAFARGSLVMSVVFCALGMAAKEVMVTAPLVVLLYDRTFVGGTFAAAWRARWRTYLALAATWAILAWLVLGQGGTRGVSAGIGLGASSWNYLLTQCEALVLYLKLALWPHPLVLDYGTGVVNSLADVWWQGLLVLVLLGATLWALVRRPRWGFFGAVFFLILAPSSSFVPLVTQTIAEHRMYLPLATILLGVGACLQAMARAFPSPASRLLPLVGAAIAFAIATSARTLDYRDPAHIWADTIAKQPRNARAQHNLAVILQQQGKLDAANLHFARAIELDPDYVTARYNWAAALLAQNRTAEAIAQFEAAIRLAERASGARADPGLADAHFQLALLAERAGDRAGAERHYEATLRLAPRHSAAHVKLGVLCARSNRLDAAATHLRTAVEIAPSDADVLANFGNVLLLQGKPREALERYEQVLRLRPGDRRTLENIQLAREALR